MAITYRISELAAELGVTPRTIRFYEEQGLVAPKRKGQERVYSSADKESLQMALLGKQLGLSLNECHEVLTLYTAHERGQEKAHRQLSKVHDYQKRFEAQQRAVGQMQRALSIIEQRCQRNITRHQTANASEWPAEPQPSLFDENAVQFTSDDTPSDADTEGQFSLGL